MSDQALMNYLNFDQDDLSLNRELHFSKKQQARVLKEVRSSNIWGIVGGICLVVIGVSLPAIALPQVFVNHDWGAGVIPVIWLLILGGVGGSMLVGSLTRHSYTIAKVQGRINFLGGGKVLPELHIGGQVFPNMQPGLADIMISGDEYIVYYLTPRQEILSAELVSKAK